MNHVLGSEVDELKVGSQQQEQLNLKTKLNFLNALKGSIVRGVQKNQLTEKTEKTNEKLTVKTEPR